jgi:hypothetical protein
MHLIIDAAAVLMTCIMSLWGKHQMVCKSRIAVKSSDTLHNVPAIKLELLVSNLELLALKRGPAWQFTVDNVIEFVDGSK